MKAPPPPRPRFKAIAHKNHHTRFFLPIDDNNVANVAELHPSVPCAAYVSCMSWPAQDVGGGSGTYRGYGAAGGDPGDRRFARVINSGSFPLF
jgi:hypothetical protein